MSLCGVKDAAKCLSFFLSFFLSLSLSLSLFSWWFLSFFLSFFPSVGFSFQRQICYCQLLCDGRFSMTRGVVKVEVLPQEKIAIFRFFLQKFSFFVYEAIQKIVCKQRLAIDYNISRKLTNFTNLTFLTNTERHGSFLYRNKRLPNEFVTSVND